ncbi:hypothetical protein AMTR_s00072p00126270 [Amborella trichopoda]|uniref:Uncharacterized protein n=1 Tax=Amborella trichopoda TaxID=13333 RepID=W1NS46_AMBTC|nr:hypothetical protein AMTR_s00072p00126270 [Amborella trichopoda]
MTCILDTVENEDDMFIKDDLVQKFAAASFDRNKIYTNEGFSIIQHWRLTDEQEDFVRRMRLWPLVQYANMQGAPRQIDHDLMEVSRY